MFVRPCGFGSRRGHTCCDLWKIWTGVSPWKRDHIWTLFSDTTAAVSLHLDLLRVRTSPLLALAEHPSLQLLLLLPLHHHPPPPLLCTAATVNDLAWKGPDSLKRLDHRSVKLNRLLINTGELSESEGWCCTIFSMTCSIYTPQQKSSLLDM